MLRLIGSVTFLALLMVGCGGGGSGGGGNLTTYSIGGTVTGLTGSGLVLQTNAGDVAPVSAPGTFTFANQLAGGTAYAVTVKTQPSAPAQNCVVTNGSGTVGTANVTNVAVACSTVVTYTVGGTVTGLTGSGLVLQTNAGDVASVSKAGAFTFANQLAGGTAYAVTVKTQPSSPTQNCVVINGSGTVGTANITTVAVACSAAGTYKVGGTVSGLVGSGLTLTICQIRPRLLPVCGNPKQIGANGTYILGTVVLSNLGHFYVSISQQPSSPPQNCVISNANVASGTGFTVSCADYLTYFYVTNAADNTLLAYSIDATTGVAALIGAPTVTGTSPYAISGTSEDKRYVFVGNEGSNDVSAFAVDPTTGALTALPGSPFPAGTDPRAMAVDPYSNLYVANAGSNNVSAYTIDGSTGALTALPGSPVAVGKSPTSVVLDFNGGLGFAFVANHGGSNDISAVSVPGSPFPAGGNPLSLALGAGGKFLYSANPDTTNPSISGFSVDLDSGALSPLSGSPFPLPVSHYIATDQTGAYLYVTSGASIVGYAIDATTGALTALLGFPVATGANAYSITIDPSNRILYVTNDGAATVSGFTLDASTGALTPMAGSPFPAGNHPAFIAAF